MTDEQQAIEFYKENTEAGIKELISFVDHWYYGRCPSSLANPNFYRFVAQSYGMMSKAIAGREIKPVIFRGQHTAFTDLKNIYIPAMFFTEKFMQEKHVWEKDELAKVALCLFNGMLIHESLHVATAKDTYIQWARNWENDRPLPEGFNNWVELSENKIFISTCNTIDDIFIEEFARVKHPTLSLFIEYARDWVMNNPGYKLEVANEFINEPTIDMYLYLVNLLTSRNFAESLPDEFRMLIGEEAIEIALKAMNAHLKPFELQAIAYDMFELLLKMQSESEGEEQEQQQGDGDEEGDGQGQSGDGDEEEQSNSPSSGKFSDSVGDYQMGSAPATIDSTDPDVMSKIDISDLNDDQKQQLQEIIAKVAEAIENEQQQTAKHDVKADFMDAPKDEITIDYKDILDDTVRDHWYGDRGSVIEPNRRFSQVGNLLRHARSVKSNFGIAREKGRRIKKRALHRIATDSKILVRHDRDEVQKGEPEILILGDVSGSTCGARGDDGYDDLLHSIVCGCYGLYVSFRNAQIPVAVYVHTAQRGMSVIRGVACYRMPMHGNDVFTTENHKERFSRAMVMSHNTNADGNAIAHIAGFFTKLERTKIIIVLSDGSPTVYPNFTKSGVDDMGEAWTRENVNMLRNKGINVFSVSLTRGVVAANDRIYGEEFNVRASHGLMKQLQQLAFKIGVKY